MKKLPLVLSLFFILAFSYEDRVTVGEGTQEMKVMGLPFQKHLTQDPLFAHQNATTWAAWFPREDSVFFCSGSHPTALVDSVNKVPADQVLFRMSMSAFDAAAALPDSTYYVVPVVGTLPNDQKGKTWGAIHVNDLTQETE